MSDFSPETEQASKEFLRCLEKKDDIGKSKLLNKPTVAQSLLTVTKRLLSKIQPAAIPPPTDPSCSDPIDENAFQLHRPNWKSGHHRSIGEEDNTSFNLKQSSDRAKSRAVSRNVNSILEAGDDDQIALGLRETINHPQIRPYATRVWGQIVSEESSVGIRAVQCMREMTNRIADSKNNGMLSKTYRSFLEVIGMCVTKDDNTDKGTLRAIKRQIL